MAKSKTGDKFANIAALRVDETVAGTIAYGRLNFPFSVMDKVALIINRLEYWPIGLGNLNSTSDQLVMGLLAASTIVDIANQADPSLLDSCRIVRYDLGVAASGVMVDHPVIKDFSSLPGGGILCAPSPLYFAVQGTGGAGVMGFWGKIFYTYTELSTDEYWELVESRRIISS